MHKCELTNERLQAEIDCERELAAQHVSGTETRKLCALLASALQELLDRRNADDSDFRRIEASLAYDSASSFLETNCSHPNDPNDADEYLEVWFDLDCMDADGQQQFANDAVSYLNSRGLLDRHPDHPSWISVRDEDEPRADGPLDPCPEVK